MRETPSQVTILGKEVWRVVTSGGTGKISSWICNQFDPLGPVDPGYVPVKVTLTPLLMLRCMLPMLSRRLQWKLTAPLTTLHGVLTIVRYQETPMRLDPLIIVMIFSWVTPELTMKVFFSSQAATDLKDTGSP